MRGRSPLIAPEEQHAREYVAAETREAPLPQSQTTLRCAKCHQPLRLLERLWNPKTARTIRVYKCQCGELVWDD